MAKHASNLIALAVCRDALHLAEFSGSGPDAVVVKRSVLTRPSAANLPPELPGAPLGEALRAHLAEQGYTAKRVAVGLPGAWVLARRWDVPPVEDAALAGIVRLRIEKEFASGPARLAFDYTRPTPIGDKQSVLVVGVREDRLQGVQEMLAAAGLEPTSIGATALDAAKVNGTATGRSIVLEGPSTTLVDLTDGVPTGLASTSTAENATRWAGDVSRMLATSPAPAGSGVLQLIDLPGDQSALIETGTARWPDAVGRSINAAEAVGRAALSEKSKPIDWLSGRMAPPKPQRIGRTLAWAIRVAAVLLLVALVTGYFWIDTARQRDALRDELSTISADAQRLGNLHERTRAAAGWFDQRPPVLDCLLELTRTFPQEGEVWVTQFSLGEDRQGVVRGKARDKQTMLAYLQEMQRSSALQDTELRDWNESGREQRIVTFEITFRYDGDASPSAETAGAQIVDDTPRAEQEAAG